MTAVAGIDDSSSPRNRPARPAPGTARPVQPQEPPGPSSPRNRPARPADSGGNERGRVARSGPGEVSTRPKGARAARRGRSSEPGAFKAVAVVSELFGSAPGAFKAVAVVSELFGSAPGAFKRYLRWSRSPRARQGLSGRYWVLELEPTVYSSVFASLSSPSVATKKTAPTYRSDTGSVTNRERNAVP